MSKKTKLPREFWAVNASNLFERGAYYGMLAVFSYHLVYNVGIESWMVGILTGISMGLINFLPLISTAIASKYGFKKILYKLHFSRTRPKCHHLSSGLYLI